MEPLFYRHAFLSHQLVRGNIGPAYPSQRVWPSAWHTELWNKNLKFLHDAPTTYHQKNAVTIKPTLVLRNSGDLATIYSKPGLAISVFAKRYTESTIRLSDSAQNYFLAIRSVESSKAKVGFNAAFGISFRVSEAVAISCEANGQMIALPITKGYYSKYELNGKDMLPGLDKKSKERVYKRSGYVGNGPPNEPDIRLCQPANFSFIGISVGYFYYF